MNNKAILAFKSKLNNNVKYGKWAYRYSKLYFNGGLIGEFNSGGTVIYPKSLPDCGFKYPTFHTIEKAVKFLSLQE